MTKLLLATQNQGKINEIKQILHDLQIEVMTADPDFDVEETGATFEENALLKANGFSQKYPGVLVLADDSGLIVDALDGRPGVYSKRYGSSDFERNTKLLAELKNIEENKRTARFVSVMALVGVGVRQVFEGTVEGTISTEIRGQNGFGYDPVFIPAGYEQTFAELGTDVKNTMSHRARALEKVKYYLEKVHTNPQQDEDYQG